MARPTYHLSEEPLDRVPVPVIPIHGQTLLQCKKCGSIQKFEAPYLKIFSSGEFIN